MVILQLLNGAKKYLFLVGFLFINAELASIAWGQGTDQANLEKVDLQIFGDFYLSERIANQLAKAARDGLEPMRPWLQRAEHNVVNFEGVASDAALFSRNKTYTLRMSAGIADYLHSNRITAVTLGNNHSMDLGPFALLETMAKLSAKNIAFAGAGTNLAHAASPILLHTLSGTPYCIFSFNRTYPAFAWAGGNSPGSAFISFGSMAAKVKSCAQLGFLTIAVLHWGAEQLTIIQPYQRKLAQLLIDAGALMVVGHHSHLQGPIEWYKDRPIFYSIGNFLFSTLPRGQNPRPQGLMVSLKSRGDRIDVEARRLDVDNRVVHFQPRVKELFLQRSLSRSGKVP